MTGGLNHETLLRSVFLVLEDTYEDAINLKELKTEHFTLYGDIRMIDLITGLITDIAYWFVDMWMNIKNDKKKNF